MSKIIHYIAIIGFGFSTLLACEKDEVGVVSNDNPSDSTATEQDSGKYGIYISNEGNFQWGNGSLSFYQPDSQKLEHKVFKSANDGQPGDVVQSMSIIDDKGYVVVNNSQKIEVVDMETMERITTITGLNSPRYLLQVADNRAYCSDLYADQLAVIDLNSHNVTGHIPLTGWTEEMTLIDNKAYVTNMDSGAVYQINTQTNQVVDTITVGIEPNSIVKGSKGMLWVLCSGGFSEEKPSLVRIDPSDNTIVDDFTFPDIQQSPDNLAIDRSAGRLYYLNDGVYKMALEASSLPEQPLVSSNDRVFYSLGVHQAVGEFYVSDAKDYTKKGDIYRYSRSGTLVDSFTAGIIPGHFTFYDQ